MSMNCSLLIDVLTDFKNKYGDAPVCFGLEDKIDIDHVEVCYNDLYGCDVVSGFMLIGKEIIDDEFIDMAKDLRELWPVGSREIKGKQYPWRDTVTNIARKLRHVWKRRHLQRFSKEDVLQCARSYLSQYESDKAGMCGVSYFVLKETKEAGTKQEKSILADRLDCMIPGVKATSPEAEASIGGFNEGDLV